MKGDSRRTWKKKNVSKICMKYNKYGQFLSRILSNINPSALQMLDVIKYFTVIYYYTES